MDAIPPRMWNRDEIINNDRHYLWRPYTANADHQAHEPLLIARAEGVWLYDVDGNRYLDGNGSWWTNTLGHGHPRLRKVLHEQSEELLHCAFAGISHPHAVALAKELLEVAPAGMARVFFSDNGSTAVEVALKMAFQYWQQNRRPERTRFIALANAFHGDTLGCTSLGGVDVFRKLFGPLLFEVFRAPEPVAGDWQPVLDAIVRELEQNPDTIAGVVVEPLVQGAAGMQIYPATMLRALRDATERAGTFLIADEVFTGYGRTGKMWACDHAGISPDILCTAKAFSGGVLPMAATLASTQVYDGFNGGKERALMYGHTFYGNPLGAALAREVLNIYRDEDVVGQVQRKAPRIGAAFEQIKQLPGVKRVRNLGAIAAADLGSGGYYGRTGWLVYQQGLKRGAYLRPLGDTIYITPPLVISDRELDYLLETVQASIEAAYRSDPWE